MRFVGVLTAALVGAPTITLGLACAASTLEPPPVPEAVVVVAPPPTAAADGPRGTSTGPARAGLDAADAGAPGPDPDEGDEGADPPVGLSGLTLLLDGGVASFQLQGSIHIAGTFTDDGGVRLSFTSGLFDDGGVTVSIQGGSSTAPPGASGPPGAGTTPGAAPPSGGAASAAQPYVGPPGLSVSGAGDARAIRDVLLREQGRVRACYEAGLAASPALHGVVQVRFTIDAAGTVTGAAPTAGSHFPDAAVSACIARAYTGLRFPPAAGATTVHCSTALAPSAPRGP